MLSEMLPVTIWELWASSKRGSAFFNCLGQKFLFISVQFSRSVMSNSLWPHGLLHVRLPCPSQSPWVCSNSCLRSRWCHPTISSSVALLSSSPQSFPVSGSLPMSRLFISDGQSIGVSASASILPVNIQDWFPLRLTGLISLLSKGLSRVFSSTTVRKHQFLGAQPSLWSNSHIWHDYWKNHSLTMWTFVGKVISLLFNILSKFLIAFLPRNKRLLISWL